jgi:hypothetical protein
MSENIFHHYIMGVSLGMMRQPTAIAVIEQEMRSRGNWAAEQTALRLRHLERPPMDNTYPQTIKRIETLLKALEDDEADDQTDLIVDVTGTGNAVSELMKENELKPINVTITGGSGEGEPSWYEHRVSKANLVGTLQVLYQAERIKIAQDLELVPTFIEELQNFKMRPPVVNENDPEAWREGQFSDLVFAVALATWRTTKHTPQLSIQEIIPHQHSTGSGTWMS